MIHFTLHSAASPDGVLAAIRAHGGEWRESHIPPELRRIGVLDVECDVRGAVARLRYAPVGRSRGLALELSAAVAPDPAGGTTVDVRVYYRDTPRWALALAGVWAVAAAWLFGWSGLSVLPPLMALALVAFSVFSTREANANLLRRELGPSYLIERLEQALAAAEPRVDLPAN